MIKNTILNMIKINAPLFTFFLIISFASCKAQNYENSKGYYFDTAIFKIDTTISDLLIDGKVFSLQVLRDKFNEHQEKFTENSEPNFEQSPMTVLLRSSSDKRTVYIKKFDFEPDDNPSLIYLFYKGQSQDLADKGRLYLMLNKGYGGSGSQSIRYYFSFDGSKINLNQLFSSSGELSYIVYNKNDNEIILLEGIWNMKENESHFVNHRYVITKYTYRENYFDKKIIGQTKFKYSSLDEDKPIGQILIDIKAKEPLLLKGINLNDYK